MALARKQLEEIFLLLKGKGSHCGRFAVSEDSRHRVGVSAGSAVCENVF
jgi:hypothetical protein